MRRLLVPLLVILIGAVTLWQQQGGHEPPTASPTGVEDGELLPDAGGEREDRQRRSARGLPAEALDTVELIQRGGPYPYRQDDQTFGNREGLLPDEARDYYREYTVPTPGSPDRGARRIVTGGSPPSVWYYTDDHYRSFRPFDPDEEPLQ
jgi:guanyl-specific ribonuclease Sa